MAQVWKIVVPKEIYLVLPFKLNVKLKHPWLTFVLSTMGKVGNIL